MSTNTNTNLGAAREAKRDEFYTQLTDVENELRHYRKHFRNKVIFCNCDDPFESAFFKYFALNFNAFGLKQLIATSYAGSPIAGTQLSLFDDSPPRERIPYKVIINEVPDVNGDGATDLTVVEWLIRNGDNVLSKMDGNGDFRCQESVELLKRADIVATNPPFSLFRDFVEQLFEHEKDFVIIGNKNGISLKEIFPLLRDNKMWVGNTPMSREMYFDVPQSYIDEALSKGKHRSVVKHNGRWMHRSQSVWYTNLDIAKRHREVDLFRQYTPDDYPQHDNYDAIEVGEVVGIPEDYAGAMAVPISFLDKYNPEQFEILDANEHRLPHFGKLKPHGLVKDADSSVNGKRKYVRILIRNRNPLTSEA